MSEKFKLAHDDRDAWASLRGYAYQVDRTLIAWLTLNNNEALELECGEDIDLVAPALLGPETDLERTFEQVKCLDHNVTLRSASTREALCSFADHIEANPSLSLRFRFLTNALPGVERPAEPLLFVPGIQLWEDLRLGRIGGHNGRAALESIAAFLQSLDAPRESIAASWQKTLALTRSFDRFAAVLSRFEWSTGATGFDEIAQQVEQLLLQSGYAATPADAKARHDQLFVFVLRTLAQRKADAPRRLDVQSLKDTLASGVITDFEREILGRIKALACVIEDRFTRLDAEVGRVKDGVSKILAILKPEGQTVPSLKPVVSAAVRESLRIASSGLLSWPQETKGRWLERPELGTLENIILTQPQSCTLLLGSPGTGKSAVLARLGNRLEDARTTLLALKTDQLPQTVAHVADLDAHLELHTPLVATIMELARAERVVLLIDQLDAIAALMDQRTNRLHVVLQLVHQLKNAPNVHLVISCRAFDFKYDSRLASLGATAVELSDPLFDAVRPFLVEAGASPSTWPSEMCEMLRNPQHLNVFLSHFAGDSSNPLFESYQSMLEATFRRRVLEAGTASSAAACEDVAATMSDSEELWIGRSTFDQRYPGEIDRLMAADILQEKGRTIGFRHQTLFDYVRTQTFCSGASSLSQHILLRQDALFVRSTAWASLHALRASSLQRYCAEMRILWEQPELRKHLRLLLISFLGQVADPDVREVQWLLGALDEAVLRGKVLAAIVGNPAWFARMQSRLPDLMAETDSTIQWQVSMILGAALAFDRAAVLRLIGRHWSVLERDGLILQTFRELSEWDEQIVALIEPILGRQPVQGHFVVHIAKSAAKKQAGYGARLVRSALGGALRRGIEQEEAAAVPPAAEGEGLDRAIENLLSARKRQAPVRGLINTKDWHGLEEVARAEPASFAAEVFPVVVSILSALGEPENPRIVRYQDSTEVELDGDLGGRDRHILQSVRLAFEQWGQDDPDGFLGFARRFESSELLLVHRLLAYGLVRAARRLPEAVLAYLTADPRRLSLGGYSDHHHETRLLISAVSTQLPPGGMDALEQAASQFDMYKNAAGDDAETRWHRRRWNREHRLRVLRAVPAEKLSAATKKLRDEEEIALPDTRDYDSRITGGVIGSPVSAEQMRKAADEDILNLFAELSDETGSRHPRLPWRGGAFQASQAFGVFAKDHPARAVAIIERLEQGRQELPAAFALDGLAQSELEPGIVVDLIRRLSERGFAGSEFRDCAGWVLPKLADRSEGLSDDICSMLESWLTPASGPGEDEGKDEEVDPSRQPHSLLWGLGVGGILPHGNYPILNALQWGYRCRIPPAIDRLLDVLCRHMSMTEHPAVWSAFVDDLAVLGAASDRSRALSFLRDLFGRFPAAIACERGVYFLAWAIRWLPPDFLEESLRMIESSGWASREQAIGEIAMLRCVLDPADAYCRSVVARAIEGEPKKTASDLRRVGIAFAAVNLWAEPEFRARAHAVLMPLCAAADGYLPGAIMDIFSVTAPLPPDIKARELLSVIAEKPDIIRGGSSSFITERLKELLADGFDPSIVALVMRALLAAVGSAIGDIRTAWSAEAGDLIEIAITLQRFAETRKSGLDLFETLRDLGAYEGSQVLRQLDRRPV